MNMIVLSQIEPHTSSEAWSKKIEGRCELRKVFESDDIDLAIEINSDVTSTIIRK